MEVGKDLVTISTAAALVAGASWCAIAACSSSHDDGDAGTDAMTRPGDAGVDAPVAHGTDGGPCDHDFHGLDTIVPDVSCTTDSDCVVVQYAFACCPGAVRWRGVAMGDEARFSADIAACDD